MKTFRQFIEDMEAAPPAGAAKSPTEPDPGTKIDKSVLDRELDIDTKTSNKITQEGEFITCTEPLIGLPQQDFLASSPIMLQVKKVYPDGSVDVKVMFSMTNKSKLKLRDGQTEYKGPVKDIDNVHITKEELDRIRIGPMKSGGGGGMGGGMPAGGPPGGPLGGM